jgi:hypothetical protein
MDCLADERRRGYYRKADITLTPMHCVEAKAKRSKGKKGQQKGKQKKRST